MPKTPIEVLDTVLELGTEALVAYQNPSYGSGINANAAGGIFSNLISRHGITPTTLTELRATLEPIGVILADPAGTEEAALDVIARLKKAYPTLFSVPDYPDVTKLNEEIALLKAELQTTHLAASAQIDRLIAANTIAEDGSVPPVPDGAMTFTPTHALVSALVDVRRALDETVAGEDLGPEGIATLAELVESALSINAEIAAIAARMAADAGEEEDLNPVEAAAEEAEDDAGQEVAREILEQQVGGFTARTEPTVLSEATFDEDGPLAPPPVNPQGTQTGRLPNTPNRSNVPREPRNNNRASRGGRGRGR